MFGSRKACFLKTKSHPRESSSVHSSNGTDGMTIPFASSLRRNVKVDIEYPRPRTHCFAIWYVWGSLCLMSSSFLHQPILTAVSW